MPVVCPPSPRTPLARSAARCAFVALLLLDVRFRDGGGGGNDGGPLGLSLPPSAAVRRPVVPSAEAAGRHCGGGDSPYASCRLGKAPLLGARGSGRSARGRSILRAAEGEDWREFRARLVEKELGQNIASKSASRKEGWAYASPLIEKGSVLLCQGGDHFALNQQYFHKALLLVIRHSEDGTTGLILNRPTAFTTQDVDLFASDLPLDQLGKTFGLSKGSAAWPIWFGGDCQGLDCRDLPSVGFAFKDWELSWSGSPVSYFCMHTLEGFAGQSEEVIRGVYLINIIVARTLVETGQAKKEDFMVLTGYCGWRPGQLQKELDGGGVWTLLAADQKALVTALSGPTAATLSFESPTSPVLWRAPAQGVSDGIAQWERLQTALGEAVADSRSDDMSNHVDAMLRLWIDSNLLPEEAAGASEALQRRDVPQSIEAGTVLRGSATHWLLGMPIGAKRTKATMRFRPSQFLHKAVLLLVQGWVQGRPAMVVVLNGPKVGYIHDGTGEVFFGGTNTSKGAPVLRIPGGITLGCITFASGVLEELLSLGAIEVAQGISLGDTLNMPVEERWLASGGELNSLRDVSFAAMGDQQLLLWYSQMLGLQ